MKIIKSINDLLNILRAKIEYASYRMLGRREKFKKIYKEGGFGGREFPPSGAETTLEQTIKIKEAVLEILKELSAKSFLDAIYGDCTWMEKVDLGNIFYLGGDIK
jgi:hypothetical protein